MSEYTENMMQLLHYMNKVHSNDPFKSTRGEEEIEEMSPPPPPKPKTTQKKSRKTKSNPKPPVQSHQFDTNPTEGKSWDNRVVGVASEEECHSQMYHAGYVRSPELDPIIIFNYDENQQAGVTNEYYAQRNDNWDRQNEMDLLNFDNHDFADESNLKRKREEYEAYEQQSYLGGDEFADESIEMGELNPAKRLRYAEEEQMQSQHEAHLLSTVLEYYLQFQRAVQGDVDPSHPPQMPTMDQLREFHAFLESQNIETIQREFTVEPQAQPRRGHSQPSPTQVQSSASQNQAGNFKYLVCSGPMKRKNKRQEPEDKWTMKWKLCN